MFAAFDSMDDVENFSHRMRRFAMATCVVRLRFDGRYLDSAQCGRVRRSGYDFHDACFLVEHRFGAVCGAADRRGRCDYLSYILDEYGYHEIGSAERRRVRKVREIRDYL